MLSSNFFNLAEKGKKDPVVRVEAAHGGIQITFSDGTGSDLQIVLSPKGLNRVYAALDAKDYLEDPWKALDPEKWKTPTSVPTPEKKLDEGPWPVPMAGQQLPA